MIVIEVGIQRFITRNAYVAPATFEYTINIKQLAYFWTQVLGVPSEVSEERIFVLAVIGNYTEHFAKVDSVAECKHTLESWVFDMDSQILTINYGKEFNPLYTPVEYLRAFGLCDMSVIYVDDVAYLPVISAAPKISQMQDLIGYNKIAFNSGSFDFNNEAGLMDFMRTMSLFNNDVAMYWLDYDGRSEYTRDELVPLAWYLWKNLEISKRKGSVALQDIRASWSKKIPSHLFSITEYPNIEDKYIDKPIPLLFGSKVVKAFCTNGEVKTGNVNYRVAESLSGLGVIWKIVDNVKIFITPISFVLESGEFILSEADARKIPGGETTGDPVEIFVQAIGVCDTGQSYSTPLEVLKYIERNYNNAAFTSSFFNMTEITEEIGALKQVAIYINKQVEIYEFIRQMQEGSSNRFRYDIDASGVRTARLDNLSRTSSMYVTVAEILENEELRIYTDKDTVAASIKINFAKDEIEGTYSTVVDVSRESVVAQNAREKPELEFDTFLTNRADATARALLEATRLGQIRRFTDCTLRGKRFLVVRIYDIITVELIDENREWMGVWNCQILSIGPDTANEQNLVKLLLVERIEAIDENRILKIGDDGNIKCETENILRVGE